MPVRVSRNHHIGFLDVAVHALVVVEIQDARLSFSKIERDRTSTSCLAQIKPVIRVPHNSKMYLLRYQNVQTCGPKVHRLAEGSRPASADSRPLHSHWPSAHKS